MTLALAQKLSQFLGDQGILVLMVIALVVILSGFALMLATRYKRCPSNRILVIYGRTGAGQSSRPLHGGGAFVWPLIQSYEFLDLDPLQIEIPLEGALSSENIRVSVPSIFTVAIGTDEEAMNNAAVRLLGLDTPHIIKQAEDIIFGQLRQVIASMAIQEINRERDTFLGKVQSALEPELKKIGLVLINVNIRDIKDESGFIEAIGRKAAATAIQQAEIDVAEQNKRGAIGVAEAERERAISVANAEKVRDIGTKDAERERAVKLAELERDKRVGEQAAQFEQEAQMRDKEREMRVRVADANAKAVAGENKAKAEVAATNAELRVKEAQAYELGEKRFREAQAAVLEAQYRAEARAAAAQGEKIEAETRAALEATSKAEKAKTIVDAEAQAAQKKIEAEGEAAAIFAKLEAEARGQYEILAKKAAGLKLIVDSCGGSQPAFQMLMLEHLDHLSETAAKAISNIKFDKVVVWDSGAGGPNGGNAAANFVRGLGTAIPPVMQIMKDVGGVEMPEYFGKLVMDEVQKASAPAGEAQKSGGKGEPKKPA
ncbi:MAG: flotillin family protein [Planctomycetes bacterium]|nr:flotillin family protein [Planctomycetota bacterium]